jgi:CheY-like chemotaxis protein
VVSKKIWQRIVTRAKLPFTEKQSRVNYTNLFPSTVSAAKLRVLLVEDDEPDAYLIGRFLASNPRVGEVVVAEDGVKAFELVDKGWLSPDLAIIDLHMPRKDGLALLRDFADREGPKFPSVILTSSQARADSRRAFLCGAMEFITKPDMPDQLAAALDRVCNAV